MDRFAFRIHYERAAPMLFATLLLCQRFASQSTTLLSNNMLNSKVIAILESNSNYNHVSKYITPYQTTGLINCWGLWWVMSWWRCRSKRNLEIWMTPFPLPPLLLLHLICLNCYAILKEFICMQMRAINRYIVARCRDSLHMEGSSME